MKNISSQCLSIFIHLAEKALFCYISDYNTKKNRNQELKKNQ